MIEFASLAHFAAIAREKAKRVDSATITLGMLRVEGSLAKHNWEKEFLNENPNEEECAFCPVMARCPAARAKLEREVGAGFDVIDENAPAADVLAETLKAEDPIAYLDRTMAVLGFLEDWAKAVRAETEARLLGGQEFPSWGLELGREGNRNWRDPKVVEELMRKKFKLKMDLVYDRKLKSPTTLEKMAKGKGAVIPEARWAELQRDHVVRAAAVPSVKHKSRIKTPYTPTMPDADAFDVVDESKPITLEDPEQPPIF